MKKESSSDFNIMLSVCLITYNHGKFIREALDGIFKQKVNFTWEVIIADDFSTDNTREIILEYKEKHPHVVKLIFQQKNVGAAKNWLDLISSPSGKYIAYFEGDDYWTDPHKLQKQVDFLEGNEDYVLSFHDVKSVDEHSKPLEMIRLPNDKKKNATQEELSKYLCVIPTLTMCFRNVIKEYPIEFTQVFNGDVFLRSLLGAFGAAYYHNDIQPSMYRIHMGSVWSSKNKLSQSIQLGKTYKIMGKYYERVQDDIMANYFLNIRFKKQNESIFGEAIKAKNTKLVVYYFIINVGLDLRKIDIISAYYDTKTLLKYILYNENT